MKTQFEQKCNAEALKQMGVLVIKKLSSKYTQQIKNWLLNSNIITVDYPDTTANIINMIFEKHVYKTEKAKKNFPNIETEKLPINH